MTTSSAGQNTGAVNTHAAVQAWKDPATDIKLVGDNQLLLDSFLLEPVMLGATGPAGDQRSHPVPALLKQDFDELAILAMREASHGSVLTKPAISSIIKEHILLEARQNEIQDKLKLEQQIKQGAKSILSLSTHNPNQNAMVYAELISTYRREIFLLRQLCSYALRQSEIYKSHLGHNTRVLSLQARRLSFLHGQATNELTKMSDIATEQRETGLRLRTKCTTLSQELERAKILMKEREPKPIELVDESVMQQLRARVDELERENSRLRQEINLSEEVHVEMLKIVREREATVERLQKSHEAADVQCQTDDQESDLKQHYELQIKALRLELASALEQLDHALYEVKDKEDHSSRELLRICAEVLGVETDISPSLIVDHVRELAGMKSAFMSEQAIVKSLKEETIDAKKALHMKTFELNEAKERLSEEKGMRDRVEQHLVEAGKRIEELERDLRALTHSEEKHSMSTDNLQTENGRLQRELRETHLVRKNLEHDCEQLITELERLTREWTDFDQERRHYRQDIQNHKKQIRELQAVVVEKQNQLHHRDEYLEETNFFGSLADLKLEFEKQFDEEYVRRVHLEEEFEKLKKQLSPVAN